jgi:two-component system NarL family sensor kinase
VAAFRIVSEAVSNAVRHAGASRCGVAVNAAGPQLRIVIADDGRGFDAARPLASIGGHGLHTMRERAEELGGLFHISSDAGTTVVAELPLPVSTQRTAVRTATEAGV